MKSETYKVHDLFRDRRQFRVPFYQRAYVWNRREQWEPLWADILAKATERLMGEEPTPHFLGAVVVEQQPSRTLRGVQTLHIIDGQQRLTTLQYVLAALDLALRERDLPTSVPLLTECRINGNPSTMDDPAVEQHKVWPTFRDQDQHVAALTAPSRNELKLRFPTNFTLSGKLRSIGIDHPPALEALWYFAEQAVAWLDAAGTQAPAAADALVEAVLTDLKLVGIFLEVGDDAQVIFETLNGRGAQLNATDLIRNFIFMRATGSAAQTQVLYDKGWRQFESPMWQSHERRGRLHKPKMEWMLHSSLQVERRQEIELSRLYNEYKTYATQGQPMDAAAQLATLSLYAEHYRAMTERDVSTPIGNFGNRIAAHEATPVHPLALLIATRAANSADQRRMFDDLVSFIVRRAVCGITAKNYNSFFLATMRHLARDGVRPEILNAILSSGTAQVSKWPRDDEFKHALMTAPLYPGRLDAPKMRWLLTELEARSRISRRTEEMYIPSLSSLDIDHIMPRNWFAHWVLADGTSVSAAELAAARSAELIGMQLDERQQQLRRREAAVPTLGNLTLLNLSINRGAQDKEFAIKRGLLASNSNLTLNGQLAVRTSWDEQCIQDRAAVLAEFAIDLYPSPTAPKGPYE